ncbi:conjugal transfer protein TraF [Sulfurimonas sp. HSL3-7]|uniref:conjugal transfer protein TraF n=1 Tax=Sulfonitrofixus jiaomeiensis TaxID=3131938 RepID=UPI0031F91DB4
MQSKLALSLSTILLLGGSSLHALKFETLGYKSVSMGGAAVASSAGSIATYNNPALLAKTPYGVEVSLGGGISEYDHGAGASIEKLDDVDFIDTLDRASQDVLTLTEEDKQNLIEGKNIIVDMDGNAISLAPQAYLAAQVQNFGFGLFGSSDSAATAVVDQAHDQLIFENSFSPTGYSKIDESTLNLTNSSAADYTDYSIEYAVNNNLTYMDVTGVTLAEVPIAYGRNFETNIGNVMVGGALKYMHALTYTERMKIDNSDEDSGNDLKKDEQSSNFGIDLGLAYQPVFDYDLTFGLVAKNINAPKFDFYDGGTYKIDPMVRAGVAYRILDSLEVAADIDLTSNKMLNEDLESQMIGGGVNYEPFTDFFALSLRAGLMKNLDANDKSDLIYTAGLGIGVKWFQVDLSGQMSGNKSTVDGTSIPQYAKVNLALISRW